MAKKRTESYQNLLKQLGNHTIYGLLTLPAADGNYNSYLSSATLEELEIDSDKRVIRPDEAMILNKEELHLARNEIYARHGRKFKDETMQAYFNSKSWYQGTIEPEDFTEDILNDVEKANIQLLLDYEANYDATYEILD